MRNGHRRTESDNYVAISSTQRLHFRLYFKQNNNQISNLLKKSNRTNLSKTVCVQSLDLPAPKSYHNLDFYFGRKGFASPTPVSIHHQQHGLSTIPQKKSISSRSLKKDYNLSLQKTNESKTRNTQTRVSQKNQFCSSVYLIKNSCFKFPKETSPYDKEEKKFKGKGGEMTSKLIKSSRLRKKITQP